MGTAAERIPESNKTDDQRGSGVISAWFRNRVVVVLESQLRGSGVIAQEKIHYSIAKTNRYETQRLRNTI